MIPLWLKIVYTLFVLILVPIYVRYHGWANFLFSDVAVLLTVPALWLENALLASMMSLSVVFFDTAWNVDFFLRLLTGKPMLGLSAFMFDGSIPLWLRAFSLFHIFLPPILLWLIWKLGYDRRAWLAQTGLAAAVLLLSYLISNPQKDVNWVYGWNYKQQTWMPPLLYVLVLIIAYSLVIYLPPHLLLKKLFARSPQTRRLNAER